MPQLVNGVWVKGDIAASEIKGGAFHREPTRFRDRITPDGAPDADGKPTVPAVAGRYHLYVSYLCPWASRTLIFHVLKGLEGVVGGGAEAGAEGASAFLSVVGVLSLGRVFSFAVGGASCFCAVRESASKITMRTLPVILPCPVRVSKIIESP